MQKLHNVLIKKNEAYAKWHMQPQHKVVHWFLLLLLVVSFAWLLTTKIKQYADLTAAIYNVSEASSNNYPDGTLDAIDSKNCQVSGWAKDLDTTNPIQVHVYRDGSAIRGSIAGWTVADLYRADLPFSDKYHGFNYVLPASSGLYDGKDHYIYVYAIDSNGGYNPLLNGSPKVIRCPVLKKPGTLQGRILWDANSNYTVDTNEVYIRDSAGSVCTNEFALSGFGISYSGPVSGMITAKTCNPEPYYSVVLPEGTYTLRLTASSGWEVFGSGTTTVRIKGGQTLDQWFLVKPKDLSIDDTYFIMPTSLASVRPDYKKRLADLLWGVNSIYQKNTQKRFLLRDILLYDTQDFCDFSISSGPAQCANLFTNPDYQIPGAIKIFVVPASPTSTGGTIGFSAGGLVMNWGYYLGNEPEFDPRDWYIMGGIAHEFGHTLGLGFPELYAYDAEIIDGTSVNPLLPTQSYLPAIYFNDPMLANPSINDKFGPLNEAMVNRNLNRAKSDDYYWSNAYPDTIKIQVSSPDGSTVSGADVKVYCLQGQGGYPFSDYSLKYQTMTDGSGLALLRKKVSAGFISPDGLPFNCSIYALKVSKAGFAPVAKALTALELQEVRILYGNNNYLIKVQLGY